MIGQNNNFCPVWAEEDGGWGGVVEFGPETYQM